MNICFLHNWKAYSSQKVLQVQKKLCWLECLGMDDYRVQFHYTGTTFNDYQWNLPLRLSLRCYRSMNETRCNYVQLFRFVKVVHWSQGNITENVVLLFPGLMFCFDYVLFLWSNVFFVSRSISVASLTLGYPYVCINASDVTFHENYLCIMVFYTTMLRVPHRIPEKKF